MIPHRIKLAGFLSYKGEQDIRFDGAAVWMLSGLNGSGKSAVFDAVTYALFGHHRGGSQNASELINKDSQSLAVEFDFVLDAALYRIRRTLKKTKTGTATATQQIFHTPPGGDWAAVPDTNKKTDFDTWVHQHVGLTYETFTSSVLLLQGKAEKLLDSKPSGRAEVLAGIVDLERYQRLHEKAVARRQALKGQLDALTHQTTAVPDVTDAEIAAADGEIVTAAVDKEAAEQQVDTLRQQADHARRWAESAARQTTAEQKLKSAERLLADAVKIEKQFARLRELREVLPAANIVVSTRQKVAESTERTVRWDRDKAEAIARRDDAKHQLELTKRKRVDLLRRQAEDETKLTETVARLRELSAALQSLKLADDQVAEVERFKAERAKLPADPAAATATAQAKIEELAELAQVVPTLDRLHTERTEWMLATEKLADFDEKLIALAADGKRLKTECDAVAKDLQTATRDRAAADTAAIAAAVRATQSRELADEFATLAGAKTCRACGQPLTPAHFAEEKTRRERDAADADKKATTAASARRAAVEKEEGLTANSREMEANLLHLRNEYKLVAADQKRTVDDLVRHIRVLKLAYAELPAAFQAKVSPRQPENWATVEYPSRNELSALRQYSAGLDAAKRTAKAAIDTASAAAALSARLDAAEQTLARVRSGLPTGDPTKLREEHRDRQAAEQSLTASIKGTKQAATGAEAEADRYARGEHQAVTDLTVATGKLLTEEANRSHGREAIERAMRGLPTDWQMRVETAGLTNYHAWATEADQLTADGVEATYRGLDQARAGLDVLRQEVAATTEAADAFPADCRQPADVFVALLADARKRVTAADANLVEARRLQGVLDGHRERRATLGDQARLADAEHIRYKSLAELLGRDRLQRHLVRQAERQIVDYANGVLDRLSGGQLFLKVVGTEDGTDKALDLECSNRTTGGSPINVAFLSGSQRFRVAVSLALGIGQYASRQHRPIESVIIDEGFGCLDRHGRQVMIQELQNLRGHLHTILLVSHQEEFADAFPDGYRFALTDGATTVTRFER